MNSCSPFRREETGGQRPNQLTDSQTGSLSSAARVPMRVEPRVTGLRRREPAGAG